jgi:polyisoprenoid-binding protein YceI
MRLGRTLSALVLGSFLLGGAALAADTYKIDPVHSAVIYKITHFNVGNAYGRFDDPTGSVTLDNGAPTGFTFEVKADKVDTGNPKRDAHLKSPDFFDAKQFPTITFKSTAVKAAGDNKFDVTGDLTLHGVTKSITLSVAKTGEGDTKIMGYRTGWETQVDLKRSDYGINGLQGPVGDDVHLIISFEAVKQ